MSSSMRRVLLPLFMFFFFIILSSISSTNAADPINEFCYETSNYTAKSTYAANLDTVFTSITSNASLHNFGTATAGSGNDTVYGLVQCRGDINSTSCGRCVSEATSKIKRRCPGQKSATMFFEYCFIHYADTNFFGVEATSDKVYWWNTDNISDPKTFNHVLAPLLRNLTVLATENPVTTNFAVGLSPFNDYQNIYALVQCTKDLSVTECMDCLNTLIPEIPKSVLNSKDGGQIFTRSCTYRYEVYQFYTVPPSPPPSPSPSRSPLVNGTTSQPPPPSAGSATKDTNNKTTIIIVVVLASAASLIFALLVFFLCFKRRSMTIAKESLDDIEGLTFDLHTIKAATNDFSKANKLGEGGFGPVYKGILKDGQEIAVKRLSTNSGQGMIEFKNEVQLIAKLQHRNLVRLLGYCVDGGEKILVYEFLPNTSLDKLLFDPIRRNELNWATRFKIIVGTARGILYLHEDSRLKIIHRDLKASNVLLDKDMNAKIADFGMAKLLHIDHAQGNTSRIAGTFGYMPPEYAMHGNFSVKSDVFSFGVLLLEIISGQKNNTFYQTGGADPHLLAHAWRLWRDDQAFMLVDETLRDSSPRGDVLRCVHIALLCVQEIADDRPHMSSVMIMLGSASVTLPNPSPPAFVSTSHMINLEESITSSFTGQSGYSKASSEIISVNDAAIKEFHGR